MQAVNCKSIAINGRSQQKDLMEVLEKVLPEVLSEEQKSKKVSNLLQVLKKDGVIEVSGGNRYSKWFVKQIVKKIHNVKEGRHIDENFRFSR